LQPATPTVGLQLLSTSRACVGGLGEPMVGVGLGLGVEVGVGLGAGLGVGVEVGVG